MSSPEREAQALQALANYPEGSTSRQIAADIGISMMRASQTLGMLFWKSKVNRTVRPKAICGNRHEYLYTLKPAIASPPTAPGYTLGPVRFAARETERAG